MDDALDRLNEALGPSGEGTRDERQYRAQLAIDDMRHAAVLAVKSARKTMEQLERDLDERRAEIAAEIDAEVQRRVADGLDALQQAAKELEDARSRDLWVVKRGYDTNKVDELRDRLSQASRVGPSDTGAKRWV